MSKGRMAGSKEFRDKIEERKGTEWYDKASKVGELHDAHMSKEDPGVARYSGAEIRAEMRAGRGDMTTEELTKKYEDMYASGEINLNGNAKEFLREQHGANLVRNGDSKPGEDKGEPEVSIPETPSESAPTPTPTPSGPDQSNNYQPSRPGFGVGGQQIQNVNQDNDIVSNVTGDNNTVTNTQDNQIMQFGGSTSNRAKMLRDRYVADVSRFIRG
jgi:hypothetical protein